MPDVEGVEKVILGYISVRQRRCKRNAHPSTEVISTHSMAIHVNKAVSLALAAEAV